MSSVKQTTKEILLARMPQTGSTPLYRQDAIDSLKARTDQWKATTVKERDREQWSVVPQVVLGSETPREMLYTPLEQS